MVNGILNSLKKQEQLDFEDRIIIAPPEDIIDKLPFAEVTYIYNKRIVPTRMVQNKELYEITYIHPVWIMNGFSVTVQNQAVQRVAVFGLHPNRDWKTGLLCLPENKLKQPFTKQHFESLVQILKTFYLDNCYSMPYKNEVRYKRKRSIYIRLNEEEESTAFETNF